ncbi:MAG: PTS glucose transporter subunit IIA [Selenomonadaceae bacterium]|nr:PTS glucose transporter subunit IIA [Selenomonadaceae bacterium]
MRNIILNAPVESGQFMSLKDCGETSFASGAMGRGAAAGNTNGRIIAPFSGRVLTVFRNAMEIVSNDGIKLFIQVGDSSFYEEACKENQQISAYQILAYFNSNRIVMFTVKNDSEFGDITFELNGQNYTINRQDGGSNRENNSSQEEDGMEGRKFTILGETGSGKTCYLLGMYYEMTMSVAGYTVIATDPDADKNLTLRYERLKNKSLGGNRFPAGTEDVQKFNFDLQYAYEHVAPFQWVDYPGGFLDTTRRDISRKDYQELEEYIGESAMLFICIDGENLTGRGTRNKIRKVKTRCAKHINPYLAELMNKHKDDGGLPPVGILITKYDLCADDTDPEEIQEIVTEAFESLFEGEHNQNFVAIIPVSLGDTLQDDSYQGDLDPLNVHLPILMGINFALIDQLHYGKALIEEQLQTINEAQRYKREEENRFFLFRWLAPEWDTDKLAEIIAENKEYVKNNRQVAAGFKKSLKRMNRELEAIDMIFVNGSWLDERGIKNFWRDVQSIADYNF